MCWLVASTIKVEGRRQVQVRELPGVLVYGRGPGDVLARVKALALRVLVDRLEHGERALDLADIRFAAA